MIRLGFTILGVSLLSGAASAAPFSSVEATQVRVRTAVTVDSARKALAREIVGLQEVTLKPLAALPRSPSGRQTFRFQQMYRGVRILGEHAVFSVSPGGMGRATAKVVAGLPKSVVPALTVLQAHDRAARAAGISFTKSAELVIVPGPTSASLAWLFFEPSRGGIPYAPLTAIDAHTGDVIFSINRVVFEGLAEVHDENPVSTPTAETTVLTGLVPDSDTLTSDSLTVYNCIDNGNVGELFGGSAHKCDPTQTAIADANGDFTAHKYENDTAPEDTYAEVAMYYHVTKAQAAMAALGAPDLGHVPATVNLRMPSREARKDPDVPLLPFDNAFFAPEEGGGGSIWFGQGEFADFSYDGDVIYHEFGHGVVGATANFTGALWLDDFGATVAPGAMNEGIADYLSATMTGDSLLGEYAGGSFGKSAIRNLDNDSTCPASLVGEVHYDSELFSSALWAQRAALPEADRVLFDVAIMDSLIAAPSGYTDFSGMASHIVAVVLDADGLGDDVADSLEKIFTAKGVLPECRRTLDLAEGEAYTGREFRTTHGFFIPSRWYVPIRRARMAPSTLQLHGEIEPGTGVLEISGSYSELPPRDYWFPEPEGDPFEPVLLVKFGADPIVFNYNSDVESDAEELELSSEDFETEIPIPDGATEFHFMFGNVGEEEGLVSTVSYQTLEGDSGSGTAGAGGEGDGSGEDGSGDGGEGGAGGKRSVPAAQDPGPITSTGGCGCSVLASTKTPPSSLAWLFLGLVPILRRRSGRRTRRR